MRKKDSKKITFAERRRFVRHPICYPLEYEYAPKKIRERSRTVNVSQGGLLFLSKRRLPVGKIILLKLPLQDKLFKVRAKVVHVTPNVETPQLFNVGVSFYRYSDAFKVKLIEQIYLIDEYRALRSVQLGREITLREASDEWIKRYSERFDKLFWGGATRSRKKSNKKVKK